MGFPDQPPADGGVDLHIAFGVDSKFVPPMGACMNSILNHNPDLKLQFHVVTHSMSAAAAAQIDDFAAQRGIDIRIHKIDEARLATLPPPPQPYSYATYLRLLVPEMLKGHAERVLYVDADIVCLGSLKGLVGFSFDGNIVAAVAEELPEKLRQSLRDLVRLPLSAPYFNSGVLFFDIEQWHAREATPRVLQALRDSGGRFPFADQDGINMVLNDQVKPIDDRWNYVFRQGRPREDTVFYHYTFQKPWHLLVG